MIHRLGAAVAAISDADWFGLCLLAALVAFTCGYLVVKS